MPHALGNKNEEDYFVYIAVLCISASQYTLYTCAYNNEKWLLIGKAIYLIQSQNVIKINRKSLRAQKGDQLGLCVFDDERIVKVKKKKKNSLIIFVVFYRHGIFLL